MIMKRIFAIAAAAVALAASLSSCVQDKVYGLPTITGINNTVAVLASDEVVVTATVTSLTGISSVNLLWAADGGAWAPVAMTATGDVWSGVIPAQPVDTEVSYYIEAESEGGETAVSATISYVVGAEVIDYSGLRLNELNGNDKFIEIYNTSGEDIPLSGICIWKDSEKSVWDAPQLTLKAGEFLLLYSEDVQADHPDWDAALIFSSGLSAKKNVRIELRDPKGSDIDDFNCTKHPGGEVEGSYGRNADGGWYIQTTATPGAANVDGTESVEGWLE